MAKCGKDYLIDIQILDKSNLKYTEEFYCGNDSIDDYFRSQAEKDQTAVTYLFIDKDEDALIACVTLACSAIFNAAGDFSTIFSAIEIKYFALNEKYQHIPYDEDKKRPTLADYILDYMLYKIGEISHNQVGASKIVLYSVKKAINFYKRHAFKEFGDSMYGDKGYYVDGCQPMYFNLNESLIY